MKAQTKIPADIDEYIDGFPPAIRQVLSDIRQLIREAAPQAQEAIRYHIPTFQLNGNLVHFAAYRKHIGFYPAPSAIRHFEKELSGYEQARGTVRFPLSQPLPYDLISRMVRFRVAEQQAKEK